MGYYDVKSNSTSFHRRDPTLYAWCVLHMITRSEYGTRLIYRRCAHVLRTDKAISIILTFHCRSKQIPNMFKMWTFKRIRMSLEKCTHEIKLFVNSLFVWNCFTKSKFIKVLRIVFNFLILAVWCAYKQSYKGIRIINVIHTFWSVSIQVKIFQSVSLFFFYLIII